LVLGENQQKPRKNASFGLVGFLEHGRDYDNPSQQKYENSSKRLQNQELLDIPDTRIPLTYSVIVDIAKQVYGNGIEG